MILGYKPGDDGMEDCYRNVKSEADERSRKRPHADSEGDSRQSKRTLPTSGASAGASLTHSTAALSTLETSPAPLAAASAPCPHPSPAVSATAPAPHQPSPAPFVAAVSPRQPSPAPSAPSTAAAASPRETSPALHGEAALLPPVQG